jgi:thiosulfate/3-mercaptopyruvate sulfurtransferase
MSVRFGVLHSRYTLPVLLIAAAITMVITLNSFEGGKAADRFEKRKVAEPWTAQQLLEPADLAKVINDPAAQKPYIISIGPGAMIKGSIDIGAAHEQVNLAMLKEQLSHMKKDANIVLYCGCCPFEHCPNVRPAFSLLNEMKFTNHKLLNLQHNIRTDWISKGYPVVK